MSWHDALEALHIRVFVCPVGQIPPAKLQEYVSLLNQHKRVNLSELTPPLAGATEKSSYVRRAGADGSLWLSFQVEGKISDDMGEFEDFQMYRHVFAAIGIGLSSESNDALFAELSSKVAPVSPILVRGKCLIILQYRLCQTLRCFVFEPPEGLIDNSANVVIIPNQDPEHLSFYIGTLISDLVVSLLHQIETLATTLSAETMIPSPRNMDSKIIKDREIKVRQRTPARIAKLLADLHILVGSYSEAVQSLTSACEEGKAHADLLWNAAAQEAMQFALVLQSEQMLAENPDAARTVVMSLPDKLRDAVLLYERAGVSILAFEANRTIANLKEAFGDLPEAAMTLSRGCSLKPDLTFGDRLYIVTWTIELYSRLRMDRKRAFFIYNLTNILAAYEEFGVALAIIKQSFSTYDIDLGPVRLEKGWTPLKRAVLTAFVKLAENHRDRRLFIDYCCMLLAYGVKSMSSDEQIRLSKALRNKARGKQMGLRPLDYMVTPCPLPILTRVSIEL